MARWTPLCAKNTAGELKHRMNNLKHTRKTKHSCMDSVWVHSTMKSSWARVQKLSKTLTLYSAWSLSILKDHTKHNFLFSEITIIIPSFSLYTNAQSLIN